MKCEQCEHEIDVLLVDVFNHDGSDSFIKIPAVECEEDAAYVETERNWTGYELSEEEQLETVLCPYCKRFPFKNTEILVHEIVRLVCFKAEKSTTQEGGACNAQA